MADTKLFPRLLLAAALINVAAYASLSPGQETPQDRANRERARADRRREEAHRIDQQQQRDAEDRRRDQERRDRTAQATRSNTLRKTPQSIIFPAIPPQKVGTLLALHARATSGLPVSYTSGGVCFVSAKTAYMRFAGVCTITAHQMGNTTNHPALSVSHTFAVN